VFKPIIRPVVSNSLFNSKRIRVFSDLFTSLPGSSNNSVGINILQLPLGQMRSDAWPGEGHQSGITAAVFKASYGTALSDLPHQCSERSAHSGVEPRAMWAMWAINVSKMGLYGSKNVVKTGALADDPIK
jgi:hypothetical protein